MATTRPTGGRSEDVAVTDEDLNPPPAAASSGASQTVVGRDQGGGADEGVSVKRILRTTTWCALAACAGHILIWIGYLIRLQNGPNWIPWEPVVGISLAAIATLSFGGFYAGARRARVAIASSFLLTFLVLLTYELTLVELSAKSGGTEVSGGVVDFLSDLRGSVGVIVGFYFGSEAAISVAKAIGVAFGKPGSAGAVMTSDRDVAVTADASPSITQLGGS
ncbi:hypothetical protein [Terrabacter sp. C0L_2]|uniref:hypothetical protein n=1 Tax=Terrabacter sp. C0L_2 TaxID=3108389 RepID=UPI002ED54601|nr:hypothetical protein U5C87_01135 [Terrabacter sp. C0L_2]